MNKILRIFCLLFFTLLTNGLSAAWVVTYTMTCSQPAFVTITGTSGITTIANFSACPDQSVSQVIPFNFTFNFDGTNYTQCVVTENGILFFGNLPGLTTCGGNVGTPTDIPNNLADGAIQRPFVAPLWEELQFKPTSTFGSGCYKTTGPVGSRVFTFEWNKMCWRAPTNTDQITFQVMLYEGTNIIDFNYFQGPTALGTFPTASIGLGAISPGTYYSLNNSTNTAVASSSSNNSSIAVKPATNQRYRWAPVGSLPILLTSFTGHNAGDKNILDWTAGSQHNNDYFTLYHSADGITFSEVTRVDGAGSTSEMINYSADDLSPFPGVTYYKLEWTDYNGVRGHSQYIAVIYNATVTDFIFPNPANSVIHITPLKIKTHYSIVDVGGKTVQSGDIEKDESIIDISELADGLYFFVLGEQRYKIVVRRPK